MDLAALAGLDTVRMSVLWQPGEQRVGGDDEVVLRNAPAAAQLDGVRLIVSIYPRDWRSTPAHVAARAASSRRMRRRSRRSSPSIRDFVVGNEPNLNLFWMPQFGLGGVDLAARSYELLLARTYDALKLVSARRERDRRRTRARAVRTSRDSLRPTHSPTAFIKDLGAAYRATKRTRPIMDMFAIHPYLIPSKLPPTFAHPLTTTIGVADYPKLVRLLTRAFRRHGAARRDAADRLRRVRLPVEDPAGAARSSTATSVRRPRRTRSPSRYRRSTTRRRSRSRRASRRSPGMLIFHVVDERDARAWQSGLYYGNGRPKTSLPAVRAAALAAQSGTLAECGQGKTTSNVDDVAFGGPSTTEPAVLLTGFTCNLPCTYQLQVLDAKTGDAGCEPRAERRSGRRR